MRGFGQVIRRRLQISGLFDRVRRYRTSSRVRRRGTAFQQRHPPGASRVAQATASARTQTLRHRDHVVFAGHLEANGTRQRVQRVFTRSGVKSGRDHLRAHPARRLRARRPPSRLPGARGVCGFADPHQTIIHALRDGASRSGRPRRFHGRRILRSREPRPMGRMSQRSQRVNPSTDAVGRGRARRRKRKR